MNRYMGQLQDILIPLDILIPPRNRNNFTRLPSPPFGMIRWFLVRMVKIQTTPNHHQLQPGHLSTQPSPNHPDSPTSNLRDFKKPSTHQPMPTPLVGNPNHLSMPGRYLPS